MFDLGIRLALPNARTVCYVEREAPAVEIMAARFEDGTLHDAPIWSDLTKFNGKAWRGGIDLICAGFPCQPFSVAGKKQGVTDKRWIWMDIARIIEECQPEIVLLENVPGLIRHGLGFVLSDLASLGFDAEWDCFRASDVGAPHKRERIFVLAYRQGYDWSLLLQQRGSLENRLDVGRGCKKLGNANSTRLEERDAESESGSFPSPWPPSPTSDDWRRIPNQFYPTIAHEKTVESSVRGMAHGSTNRVDRLRALGNGCVPSVVALAFHVLSKKAMKG